MYEEESMQVNGIVVLVSVICLVSYNQHIYKQQNTDFNCKMINF